MTDHDNQDEADIFDGFSPEERQQILENQGGTLNLNTAPIEPYNPPMHPDDLNDKELWEKANPPIGANADVPDVLKLQAGPQARHAFRALQRCEHSMDCPGFGPDHMEHANVKERFDQAVEKVQGMSKGAEPKTIEFDEAVETVRNLPEHVVDHLAQKTGTHGTPEQQVAYINAALPDGVELDVATPPAGATEHDMEQFNDFISMFSAPRTQKTITNPNKDRSLSGKKRKKAIREARRLYGKDAL